MRTKFRESQQKVFGKDKAIREVEKRLRESTDKIKKYQKKVEAKANEYKKLMETKQAIIT